jgi:hypothetical protein
LSIARTAKIAKNRRNWCFSILAITIFGNTGNNFYPCLCLCFEFSQITRTTPLRCTILHLSQIFFTDALTFMSLFSLISEPPAVFPGLSSSSIW